jgi:hypothetical protein
MDFSLSAEYALAKRLDAGLNLIHIPLVPASLSNGFKASFKTADGNPILDIHDITDLIDGFSLNSPEVETEEYGSLSAIRALRPLRFDTYAIYRPLSGSLSDLLVVKPIIGFSRDFAAEETFFVGILELQLHTGHFVPGYFFHLYFSTGVEENFWQHNIRLEFNLRAFELDFGIGVRSQNYLMSYTSAGLEAGLGIRFGW